MTGITLENVVASYPNGVRAINGLSLEIESGQLVVVAGPSGCGKTTLLRLIAGLKKPDAGRVYFDGEDVSRFSPRRRNLAMVFQSDSLYPQMSVRRNMGFAARLSSRGETTRELISRRIQVAAKRLGIDGLLDRKPFQLSGGERQRVALGRALVRDPAAFLLDEPFSNIDVARREQSRDYVREVHKQTGATVVFVTHDQEDLMVLGEKILILNEGVFQQFATVKQIYDSPANKFVAEFIGNPPMNLIRGKLSKREQRYVFCGGGLELDIMAAGAIKRLNLTGEMQIEIGLRPEDIDIVSGGLEAENTGQISSARILEVRTVGRRSYLELETIAETNVDTEPARLNVVTDQLTVSGLKSGQHVAMLFNTQRALFFDIRTAQTICAAG